MTLSNKFGWLVLTTGNKSEMATGYCDALRRHGRRLRGDQGRARRCSSTRCARDRNERAGRALIPDAVLEKPPSAELRPDQKDSDSLPDVRRCSTRSSRATSRTTSRSPSSRPTGFDAEHGAPRRAPRRPQRVQAPPGAARACACRRRRSARTAVSRSPTAGPASAGRTARVRDARFAAEAALVVAALLYGVTFPLVHDALDDITPFAYLRRPVRHRHAGRSRRSRSPALRTRGAGPAHARARRADRRRAPVRRVRDADRRAAVHVAVDVGVHHRPLRGDHAGDRGGDAAGGCRGRAVVRRHRASRPSACTCSPAPTCTSAGASCSRSRARCCSRSTSCTSARTRTVLPPVAVHRAAARRGRGAVGRRRRPQQGVGTLTRARGVRGRVHRHRVLGGRAAAPAVGPAAHPRDARRADPAGRAGVRRRSPGYVNGERLGAVELVGARRSSWWASRCRSSGRAARCPPDGRAGRDKVQSSMSCERADAGRDRRVGAAHRERARARDAARRRARRLGRRASPPAGAKLAARPPRAATSRWHAELWDGLVPVLHDRPEGSAVTEPIAAGRRRRRSPPSPSRRRVYDDVLPARGRRLPRLVGRGDADRRAAGDAGARPRAPRPRLRRPGGPRPLRRRPDRAERRCRAS